MSTALDCAHIPQKFISEKVFLEHVVCCLSHLGKRKFSGDLRSWISCIVVGLGRLWRR
jgi:hypothetical protein